MAPANGTRPIQRRSPRPLALRLQARPECVPVLRTRLRAWLEEVGVEKSELFEVLLATSEAFTNAIEHPFEPSSHLVDIDADLTEMAVTVSIRDYGTWQSEQARKEQGGLGLVLMEALMDTVQVEAVRDGTTVTMRRHWRHTEPFQSQGSRYTTGPRGTRKATPTKGAGDDGQP